jgi:hypothetical protein
MTPITLDTVMPVHLERAAVAFISESNPTGALTNSDLEMAAVVLDLRVLEPLVPSMHHKSMQIHSNNTPSVAWLTKMAIKTANSDAAHRLI